MNMNRMFVFKFSEESTRRQKREKFQLNVLFHMKSAADVLIESLLQCNVIFTEHPKGG